MSTLDFRDGMGGIFRFDTSGRLIKEIYIDDQGNSSVVPKRIYAYAPNRLMIVGDWIRVSGGSRLMVINMDTSGRVIWRRDLQSLGINAGHDFSQMLADNSVQVTTESRGSCLMRIDTNGNVVKDTMYYQAVNARPANRRFYAHPDGGVFLITSEAILPYNSSAAYPNNMYLRKYGPNGALQWMDSLRCTYFPVVESDGTLRVFYMDDRQHFRMRCWNNQGQRTAYTSFTFPQYQVPWFGHMNYIGNGEAIFIGSTYGSDVTFMRLSNVGVPYNPADPTTSLAAKQGTSPRLYPNPVRDYLTISLPTDALGEVHLTLRDMQGRVVKSARYEAEQPLYLGDVASGVYVLQLSGAAQGAWRVVRE